ncbi:hypothetical protein [Nocardiopsis dassonvillei]|uniref:Uncharacterized protein n=1 Tax=Nocardiopsis dassonvillei (strain ATCC 23218 / DSM 43111 / CIP 107115 / JCM 7437 / KCTC 9190 / NBRC 14626 / NCTC 10488 / NRRL B-5397 / IMRU 509) TaxID=446468 RepID=D7AVP3_NOCDD|nr:hypothetical protein [Nocardiopsis dassonvillei]ADH67732.1 hypothetical protein Ndas_2310 [Nocardiopsis dassonvillei subsp. dassonvillei DSM 43111]NKY80106.1 hypothetical protein [Nocardiopsis dassonvillei]VEI88165.1 Uncharacterised protein [Nocardiopsis dassonvillei]
MNETRESSDDMFAAAIAAFQSQRGLTFTVEWRRFPWTHGPDVERALAGPSYLGNVVIGLKDDFSWSYQDRYGTWKYVQRDRLDLLVDSVVEDRAGFQPPLPNRSAYRQVRGTQ